MKLLWLGIDGLDVTFVKKWLRKLPELKALTKRSAWGQLTPEIPFSPQSWTTIFSGFNAAHHGIASLDRHNMTVNTGVPLVWTVASHVYKVGVYRVPFTFPPDDKINGFMFSGWSAPYPACYPNTDKFHKYLVRTFDTQAESPVYHTSAAANQHIDIFKAETDAAQRLFTEKPVDVGIIFFSILDKLGHNIWEWRWDDSEQERKDWYRNIDKTIGHFIQVLRPETIVITSDHGFNSKEHSETVWQPSHLNEAAWHTAEGFWLIHTPQLKKQEMEMSNIDFLPSLFASMGWQVKYQMDGEAKLPWLGTAQQMTTPPKREVKSESVYTQEEQEIVNQRLRGLGYVE